MSGGARGSRVGYSEATSAGPTRPNIRQSVMSRDGNSTSSRQRRDAVRLACPGVSKLMVVIMTVVARCASMVISHPLPSQIVFSALHLVWNEAPKRLPGGSLRPQDAVKQTGSGLVWMLSYSISSNIARAQWGTSCLARPASNVPEPGQVRPTGPPLWLFLIPGPSPNAA